MDRRRRETSRRPGKPRFGRVRSTDGMRLLGPHSSWLRTPAQFQAPERRERNRSCLLLPVLVRGMTPGYGCPKAASPAAQACPFPSGHEHDADLEATSGAASKARSRPLLVLPKDSTPPPRSGIPRTTNLHQVVHPTATVFPKVLRTSSNSSCA